MSEKKAKVRLGIIGCGGILGAHAPRLKAVPEAEVVALCDVKLEAAQKWRDRLCNGESQGSTYTDYREMVDGERLDGVLVLTPHNCHYPQTKYALEHGVHVLLEKPMCLEVRECQDVIDIAEARGLALVISYQRHYDPQYVRAKRFIEAGGIGRVQLIHGLLTQDWQRGCQGKWRLSKEICGGGQLNDSGSHLQDVALWLAGASAAEVSATIDNNGEEVDIFTSISARLDNGVTLSLVVSGGATAWNEELSVWGSEGAIHYRGGQFRYADTFGKEVDAGPLPETTDPDANFIGAILRGERVWAGGLEGLKVQELTRAAYSSVETGSRIHLR